MTSRRIRTRKAYLQDDRRRLDESSKKLKNEPKPLTEFPGKFDTEKSCFASSTLGS